MAGGRSKVRSILPAEFESRVRAGNLDAVYLFLGEERYLIRQAVESLLQTVDEAFRTFNVSRYSLRQTELAVALDAARELPMMAPRRLVVIDDVDATAELPDAALGAYLASPVPETILVLIAGSLDMRRKSATMLAKAATVVAFEPLSQPQALQWVEARVRERGCTIGRNALGALVDLAGVSLTTLAREIDKLVLHAGGAGSIELSTVEALVARSSEHQIWDLTDALVARDRKRALRVLARQLDDGVAELALLGSIASTYRRMLMASELMARKAPISEIEAATRVPRWKLGEFNAAVRKFDPADLVHGLRRMAEVDFAIKNSVGTPRHQVEVLVCELTADRPRRSLSG